MIKNISFFDSKKKRKITKLDLYSFSKKQGFSRTLCALESNLFQNHSVDPSHFDGDWDFGWHSLKVKWAKEMLSSSEGR